MSKPYEPHDLPGSSNCVLRGHSTPDPESPPDRNPPPNPLPEDVPAPANAPVEEPSQPEPPMKVS